MALGYIASAIQIEASFLSDPVGPRSFPIGIGVVAAVCGLVIVLRPDGDPQWPSVTRLGALSVAVAAMIAYAYTIRPLGFLIPTALCAAVVSYLIRPRFVQAMGTGVGLSVGLFVIFKYLLGLGLFAMPVFLSGG